MSILFSKHLPFPFRIDFLILWVEYVLFGFLSHGFLQSRCCMLLRFSPVVYQVLLSHYEEFFWLRFVIFALNEEPELNNLHLKNLPPKAVQQISLNRGSCHQKCHLLLVLSLLSISEKSYLILHWWHSVLLLPWRNSEIYGYLFFS